MPLGYRQVVLPVIVLVVQEKLLPPKVPVVRPVMEFVLDE
jgi:hypothetical protein